MEQTVSVVMPAYNCINTIDAAVTSVAQQTVLPLELLVIDDGSTDGTLEQIQTLQQQYPWIRCLQNGRNSGVSITRNRGVAAAKGRWIAFLDSDDQWHPQKLEKQLALLKETGGLFSFTGSAFVNAQGEPMTGYLAAPKTVNRKQLLRQNVISCSSVIIDRELMSRFPMESDAIHEDFAAWLRILEKIPVAYGLDEPLLLYRICASSKSGNKFKSFRMNYKTYRAVGLNPLRAAENMIYYTKNGLKKYRGIR